MNLVPSTPTLLLTLALLGLAPAASAFYANLPWNPPEADEEPYLTGYLVWKDGQKRIVWDPAITGDDNLPPRPSAAEEAAWSNQFTVQKAVSSGGFSGGFYQGPGLGDSTSGFRLLNPPAAEEFVSDPLPRDAYVNVTRGFQAALYLQTHAENDKPCTWKKIRNPIDVEGGSSIRYFEPRLDLELTSNAKMVGGAYGSDDINWYAVQPTRTEPVAPADYGGCYYQMHPETNFLAKDSILRLKINHVEQQFHYSYGLAGDHRSFIRIWVYPADELYYRHPELIPRAPEPDDDGAGSAMAGLAAAGLVAPLLRRSRPSRTALLLVALVGAAGLAGCLSGKDGSDPADVRAGPSGSVDTTFVPEVDPPTPGVPRGSIRGLVHDDLHFAIQDVHVGLLRTVNFTQTDGNGRFAFLGLEPGTYRLRFDHGEYRSFEADVEVKSGFASRPDVTMFLLNPKSRDARPHVHDYWLGTTEKSLGTHVLQPQCAGAGDPCVLETDFRIHPRSAEETNVIWPGTSLVEVTLEWDREALGADLLGLSVRTGQENNSVFAPRGPGQPFRIQTSWEMTDMGHALYSGWSYEWFVPSVDARTFEEEREQGEPGHNPGTLTVKAKIFRGGALALEPAHPDHWKGKDVLPLVKDWKGWAYGQGFLPPGDEHPCIYSGLDCWDMDYGVKEFGKNVVPEGTQWLEVKVVRSADPGYGFKVHYKTADVPPQLADDSTLAGFKAVQPLAGGGNARVFRIPVAEREADDAYASWSGWVLTFRIDDEAAAWQAYVTGEFIMGGPSVEYTFNVFAHRDAMPK